MDSGRGGRDRAKGGAAAVLPGVGGPLLLLPYLQLTAPHALRDLRLTRRFACKAGQFILPFTKAREGARLSLWDSEMSSQLVHYPSTPSWPIPLMGTTARSLLFPLGPSPFLTCS